MPLNVDIDLEHADWPKRTPDRYADIGLDDQPPLDDDRMWKKSKRATGESDGESSQE